MELPFHMPARKDIQFNLAIEAILNLTLEVLSITVKSAGPGNALPWTPQYSDSGISFAHGVHRRSEHEHTTSCKAAVLLPCITPEYDMVLQETMQRERKTC